MLNLGFECVADYHARKKVDGVIRGELTDCRAHGYQAGIIPLHTALCGRKNWKEDILEEFQEPAHRDPGEKFFAKENLTYKDLEGFQIVGPGELEGDEEEQEILEELISNESSIDSKMKQEIEAWLFERYGRVIILMEMAELLSVFRESANQDTEAIQTTKPLNGRKVQREAKRNYWAKMKRRVNAQKVGKPFPRFQKARDWRIKPSQPRSADVSTVLFSKPESDEQLFDDFIAKYGDSFNTPVELSMK